MSIFKEILDNIKVSFRKSMEGLKFAVTHKANGTKDSFKDSVKGLKEAASSVKSSTSEAVPSLKKGIGTSHHRDDDQLPLPDISEDLAAKSHHNSAAENAILDQDEDKLASLEGLELETDISQGVLVELSDQEILPTSVEDSRKSNL